MMFPLYSILRREAHFAQPPSQFVLLHLKRAHLMEWVRSVVAAALGTRKGADLPRLLMQQETPSIWNQTCVTRPLPCLKRWMCPHGRAHDLLACCSCPCSRRRPTSGPRPASLAITHAFTP